MDFNAQGDSAILGTLSDMLGDLASIVGNANNDGDGGTQTATTSFGSPDQFGGTMPNQTHALGLIFEGIGELLESLGQGDPGQCDPKQGGGSGGGRNNDVHLNSFSGSDTGDPHLSFTGQRGSGSSTSQHWDDMSSENDLFHADLSNGRYQVSTTVGKPINSAGTTLNNSATVRFGDDSVSVNNDGTVTVEDHGRTSQIKAGQTFRFGNGLKVTESSDGKTTTVSMQGRGDDGKSVSTTITQAGNDDGQNYLDISVSGQNVDAGGAMVDKTYGTHTTDDGSRAPGGSGAPGGADFLAADVGMAQQGLLQDAFLDQLDNWQANTTVQSEQQAGLAFE